MDKSIHRLGGSNPIFSHGENGEKSIWKEREMNTFPFLSIYFFFPFFPWGKMGTT